MTRRLVASAVALVSALLLLLGVPFLRLVERYERERLRADLTRDAVLIGAAVEDQLSEPDAVPVADAVVARYAAATGARVVVVDRAGLLVADSSRPAPPVPGSTPPGSTPPGSTPAGSAPPGSVPDDAADATADGAVDPVTKASRRSMADRPEFLAALAGNFAALTRASATLGYSSLFVAVPVSSAGRLLGAVRVSFPTSDVEHRIAVQRTRLILLGVGLTSVVALLGALLARRLTRPLHDLRDATRRFGDGDLAARAPIADGPDDLRRLAVEFNTMAARIDGFVSGQQAFVADASHELRSPLTAIRLQLEAMEYEPPVEAERRRTRALDEVTRLSRSVDGLLVLAREDPPSVNASVDLTAVAEARVRFWESLAHERGVDLRVDAPTPTRSVPRTAAHAAATEERVTTVLDNLLSNALDASPAGSVITIAVRADGARVELHVIDEGPGMSAEQRVAAFDRFWRAPTQRGSHAGARLAGQRADGGRLGGSGLGLAIARKHVTADGAEIRLDEVTPHGLHAVVTYAAAAQAGAAGART